MVTRRKCHRQGQMHTAAACDQISDIGNNAQSMECTGVWKPEHGTDGAKSCWNVKRQKDSSRRKLFCHAPSDEPVCLRNVCDRPKPSLHVTSRPESVLTISLQIQGRMLSTFWVRNQQIRFQKRFCLFFGVYFREYPVLLSGHVPHHACNIILRLLCIKWCSRGLFCAF
jgi:hypothetical protein